MNTNQFFFLFFFYTATEFSDDYPKRFQCILVAVTHKVFFFLVDEEMMLLQQKHLHDEDLQFGWSHGRELGQPGGEEVPT